jgi:hypothetical protein
LEFGVGIQTTHYNWDISMQGTSQQSNPLVFGGLIQAWVKIGTTKKQSFSIIQFYSILMFGGSTGFSILYNFVASTTPSLGSMFTHIPYKVVPPSYKLVYKPY